MNLARGLAGFALALILGWAISPAARGEPVNVRAAEHEKEGFGRIAFDWPSPVTFEAKIDGQTLAVHFARPIEASLDAVKHHLGGYISAIMIGADGASIVATLTQKMTLRTFAEGNTIAIDVIAGKRQIASAKTPAATAVAPNVAAAATHESETVALRFGEHPGFRRVVFDWRENVAYSLTEHDGVSQLRFARPGKLDGARLAEALPDLSPALQEESGATVLSLGLPAGASLRHFRAGNNIVLDILSRSPPSAVRSPAAQRIVPPPELIEPAAGEEHPAKPPAGTPKRVMPRHRRDRSQSSTRSRRRARVCVSTGHSRPGRRYFDAAPPCGSCLPTRSSSTSASFTMPEWTSLAAPISFRMRRRPCFGSWCLKRSTPVSAAPRMPGSSSSSHSNYGSMPRLRSKRGPKEPRSFSRCATRATRSSFATRMSATS